MAERSNRFIWAHGVKADEVDVLGLVEKEFTLTSHRNINEARQRAEEFGHPEARIFKISFSVERVK